MIERFKKHCVKTKQELSTLDNRVNDIYHQIEFEKMPNSRLISLGRELKRTLKERRKVKVELSAIQSFLTTTRDISSIKIT